MAKRIETTPPVYSHSRLDKEFEENVKRIHRLSRFEYTGPATSRASTSQGRARSPPQSARRERERERERETGSGHSRTKQKQPQSARRSKTSASNERERGRERERERERGHSRTQPRRPATSRIRSPSNSQYVWAINNTTGLPLLRDDAKSFHQHFFEISSALTADGSVFSVNGIIPKKRCHSAHLKRYRNKDESLSLSLSLSQKQSSSSSPRPHTSSSTRRSSGREKERGTEKERERGTQRERERDETIVYQNEDIRIQRIFQEEQTLSDIPVLVSVMEVTKVETRLPLYWEVQASAVGGGGSIEEEEEESEEEREREEVEEEVEEEEEEESEEEREREEVEQEVEEEEEEERKTEGKEEREEDEKNTNDEGEEVEEEEEEEREREREQDEERESVKERERESDTHSQSPSDGLWQVLLRFQDIEQSFHHLPRLFSHRRSQRIRLVREVLDYALFVPCSSSPMGVALKIDLIPPLREYTAEYMRSKEGERTIKDGKRMERLAFIERNPFFKQLKSHNPIAYRPNQSFETVAASLDPVLPGHSPRSAREEREERERRDQMLLNALKTVNGTETE